MDETVGLLAQAVGQFEVFQPPVVVQQTVDLRQENAIGVDESVAIAENRLKLLNGPECAPNPGGDPGETDGTMLKALGELEHVDKVFQHARDAAVILGRNDMHA